MYAITNVRLYDFNNYIDNAYIIFDKKILEVGFMSDFIDNEYTLINGVNHIVMPSLVVGHTHIYSTFARGLSVPFNPTNFKELLEQLWWKLDRSIDNETTYYSGIVSGIEYIKHGVTTIIDHHASGTVIGSLSALNKALINDVGMRGTFCFETSDRFNVDECIEENLYCIENFKGNSRGLFGLHASMSLSDETLQKVSNQIKNSPIHIHVGESMYDKNDCINKYGERIVERLYRYGLLNKNSILSHCIYINEDEMKLIKENNCYIALNTSSNMNNGVGLPDYKAFKDMGIKCLIGNDGVSFNIVNEWQNLYYSMHHLYNDPTAFGFNDLIELIRNNYEYVNKLMDIKIGSLSKGYDADLLLIPYNPPTPINKNNIFGHIFFGLSNNFVPKHVWCNGKHILKDYTVSNDLNKKYQEASYVTNKLWNRIGVER